MERRTPACHAHTIGHRKYGVINQITIFILALFQGIAGRSNVQLPTSNEAGTPETFILEP
jgi:hypothetical protein